MTTNAVPRIIVRTRFGMQLLLLAKLGGSDGKDDGERTGEKDPGIPCSTADAEPSHVINGVAGGSPGVEIYMAIDGVGDNQAAEEENFGGEEYPHAESVGLFLLFDVVELMGDQRIMAVRTMRPGRMTGCGDHAIGDIGQCEIVLRHLVAPSGDTNRVPASQQGSLQSYRLAGAMSFAIPGLWRCMDWKAARAPFQRPDQIKQRQEIPHRQNRCSRGRHHVINLKLRGIGKITSRHAQISQHKLREEREIKPDENGEPRRSVPTIRDTFFR